MENTGFGFRAAASCGFAPARLDGSRGLIPRALTGRRLGSNPATNEKAALSDGFFICGEYRIRTGDLLIAKKWHTVIRLVKNTQVLELYQHEDSR
jgi:hypothetical protein